MDASKAMLAYFLVVMLVSSSLQVAIHQSMAVHGSTQPPPAVCPQLYGLNITKVDSEKGLVLVGLPEGIVLLNGSAVKLNAVGREEINLDKTVVLSLEFRDKDGFMVAEWSRVPVSPGAEIVLLKLNPDLLYNIAYDNIEHFLELNLSNVEQLGYKIYAAYIMWNMTGDERYKHIMIDASNYVLGTFMYRNESNPFDGVVFRTDGSVTDGLKGFAGVVLTALTMNNKDFIPLIGRGMSGYIRLMNLARDRYGVRTLPGRILVRIPDPVNKPSIRLPYNFTFEGNFAYMGGMTQSVFLAAALGSYILTGDKTYYETYRYMLDHWLSVSGEFFTYGELGLSDTNSHTSGHALDGLALLLSVYEFGEKDEAYITMLDSAKKIVENYFERLPYPYVQDTESFSHNYHAFGPAQFVWYLATYRLLTGEEIFDRYLWRIWSYVLPFIQIQKELIQKYDVEEANPQEVPSWYWNYVPYGSITGLSISKKSTMDYPWFWEWGYYGVAAALTLLSMHRTTSLPYVVSVLSYDTAVATKYLPNGLLIELKDAQNEGWFEIILYASTFGEPSNLSINGLAVSPATDFLDYRTSDEDHYIFVSKDQKLFVKACLPAENTTVRVDWETEFTYSHPESFNFPLNSYLYMILGIFIIFMILWLAIRHRGRQGH